MPEIEKDNVIKIIAFYLPQYHTIPENDQWWGKGFTEWENTKKAAPQFDGHYQPRIPYGNNYYCLLDDETKIWQAQIAQKYGVYGFCYYHYWFDGKKLLEKPVEQILQNKDIDIPFCLSWANENWTRRWDGGNDEVIMEQKYGNEQEWEKHFNYLLPFFRDERYITVGGKPLFIVYKPGLIDRLGDMLDFFAVQAVSAGLGGICFAFQHPEFYSSGNYRPEWFDYAINFEPGYTRLTRRGREEIELLRRLKQKIKYTCLRIVKRCKNKKLKLHSYDTTWEKILRREPAIAGKTIPGGFVDWDNTARVKNGNVYVGSTPEKFEMYMKRLIMLTKERYRQKMLFVNAWNEWAEGAYLEPDQKYGYGYLEALKRAVDAGSKG